MAKQTTCDCCDRVINERSAGWVTITTHRMDIAVDHDLCSNTCIRRFVADEFPERRPDFVGTRRLLDGKLSSLPVPDTTAQRVTAEELAEA